MKILISEDNIARIEGDVKIFVPKKFVDMAMRYFARRQLTGADEGYAVSGFFDTLNKVVGPLSAIAKNPLVKMAAGFIPGASTALTVAEQVQNGTKVAQKLFKKIPAPIQRAVVDARKGAPHAIRYLQTVPKQYKKTVVQALELGKDLEELQSAYGQYDNYEKNDTFVVSEFS